MRTDAGVFRRRPVEHDGSARASADPWARLGKALFAGYFSKRRDGEEAATRFCYLARMNDSTPQDPRRELQSMLASRLALIVVESSEEARVLALVREVSLKVREGRGWGGFQWTVTEGLQRMDIDLGGPQRVLADPEQLLKHLKAPPMPAISAFPHFHPSPKQPVNLSLSQHFPHAYHQATR